MRGKVQAASCRLALPHSKAQACNRHAQTSYLLMALLNSSIATDARSYCGGACKLCAPLL